MADIRLYLGSRDYRPEGFLTVDLDPAHAPDIVADVTDLGMIASGSVAEIRAGHILEHIPWPLAFKALAEWARVLRPGGRLCVAVPDLGALAAMIADGRNVWVATGLLYGLGRIGNPLEAHHFGYTRAMLADLLRALGFGRLDWWKHDLPDASNGWLAEEGGGRIALSLNLAGIKLAEPVVEPAQLLAELMADPLAPFEQTLARLLLREGPAGNAGDDDPRLLQRLHMALIEARMRILFLEDELRRRPAAEG